MEVPGGDKIKLHVFICEMLGTMFLLFSINMQAGFGFGQFGIAFTIFAVILLFGDITGAHFNPGVTFAVWLAWPEKGKNFTFMLIILLASIIGAILGVILAYVCLNLWAVNYQETVIAVLEPGISET